jgi:hypothetical protein
LFGDLGLGGVVLVVEPGGGIEQRGREVAGLAV